MFKRNMLLISVLVLALSLSGCFGIFGSDDPAKIVVNKTSVELDLDENKTADLTVVIKTEKDKDLVVEGKDITWSIADAVVEPSEAGTDNGATDPVATLSAETGDKVTVTAKSIGNAVVTVKYGELDPVEIAVTVAEEAVTPDPGDENGDEDEEPSVDPNLILFEDFKDLTKEQFFGAEYKSLPSDSSKAFYVITASGDNISIENDALSFHGSRFTLGMPSAHPDTGKKTGEKDDNGKDIFEISPVLNGELDLSKPYKITIEFSAASPADSTKKFQIYLDNNTTNADASQLGSSSRIYNAEIKALAAEIKDGLGVVTIEPKQLGSQNSFLQFRTESDVHITLESIKIEYI